jgi:vitamin B12/bleomycin/antimicrobial peptide transport system ATP-binding/permease protein
VGRYREPEPERPKAQHLAAEMRAATDTTGKILRLFGGYWTGATRREARIVTLGLFMTLVFQVAVQVRINLWYADLFNALERHSSRDFLEQVVIFILVMLSNMAVNAVHLLLKRRLQFGWRVWATGRLLRDWMSEGRHYALGLMHGNHVRTVPPHTMPGEAAGPRKARNGNGSPASNPDGRIAEDIRIATEAAVEQMCSVIYCAMLMVSFLWVLWLLSGWITIPLPWGTVDVPGHMVFLALIYAVGGTAAALGLVWPLVRAANARQGSEADFRFGLAHAREQGEALALARDEPQQQHILHALLSDGVGSAWLWQTVKLRNLNLFSTAYTMLVPVLPILVTTPRYLAGTISLGELMRIGQAFQQVTSALSWPVDNAARLAEWRASAERVLALKEAIDCLYQQQTLQCGPGDGETLVIDQVVLCNPDGTPASRVLSAVIRPREGILLSGDPHAISLFCKAVAGVWRWGRGCITLPAGAVPAILGRQPWIPEVSLRQFLGTAQPDEMRAALKQVGLAELVPCLDTVTLTDGTLSEDQRQRLPFAKLLLERPLVILLDHPTEALSSQESTKLFATLRRDLPNSMILLADHQTLGRSGFTRELELQRPPVTVRQESRETCPV